MIQGRRPEAEVLLRHEQHGRRGARRHHRGSLRTCDGIGSTTATVAVRPGQVYAFDVIVSLVAPSGTVYRLSKPWQSGDPLIVDTTYTVDLSKEIKVGAWRLRVEDSYSMSSGYIDSWTLTP